MMEINQFQSKAIVIAQKILDENGVRGSFKEEGINERFLHLRDNLIDLDIWIYVDEVAFNYRGNHVQCESVDFDSPDEMLGFFSSKLGSAFRE